MSQAAKSAISNRICKRFIHILCAVSLIACQLRMAPQAMAAEGDTEIKSGSGRITFTDQSGARGALTPGAREAANLIGVLPKVERLQQLRASHPGSELTDEELALKVELLDQIMGAALEVRMVADRIDRELSWAYNGKGMMEAKKQKYLNYLFIASFMQGGILGVTAGREFLLHHTNTGAELLLVASSVGLGLSIIQTIVQRQKGSKPVDGGTTTLAHVFNLQEEKEAQHNPEIVYKFLDSPPLGSTTGKSRKDILIDDWKKGHYLKKNANLYTLAAMEKSPGKYKENIGILGNRIRMLFDTQWTVEQLDEELLELLRATDVR